MTEHTSEKNQHADSILTVDLESLIANYRFLSGISGQASCSAVVKADAYGLGVDYVAPALEKAGCTLFFTANLDEAIALRTILPNSDIAVFHGLGLGQEQFFIEHNLIPVLNSTDQLYLWTVASINSQQKLPAILHIDTGMNRLGIPFNDFSSLIETKNFQESLHELDFRYVMSHLACASQPKHPLNLIQLERARQIKRLLPQIPLSLANSYGTFLGAEYHFDMIRPGCALYGINRLYDPHNPAEQNNNPIHQVVTLTSHIIQIHTIDTTQPVGYGATREVRAGSILATIPVGYADGYLRSLTGNAWVVIGRTRAPVVGSVSMDTITVDITGVEEEYCRTGQAVRLIGSGCRVDRVADWAETIGYEVLTRLGSRFKRVYKGIT